MAYRVNSPYDYMTQDLANDKARLFALEEIWDDEVENDQYENLRAVTTLDWDHGLDLCFVLKDLMDEIDEEAEQFEGKPAREPGHQGLAARQWGEARAGAVQRLVSRGKTWSTLAEVISLAGGLPTAVTTAVYGELARQGIDVQGAAPSGPAVSTTHASESAGE